MYTEAQLLQNNRQMYVRMCMCPRPPITTEHTIIAFIQGRDVIGVICQFS